MRRHAALLALLAAAALALGLRLLDEQQHNPFARVPINDAAVYWSWAGDIARGQLVGHEPFFSAPLYPYLLGALRAAGGGLLAALLLQLALHLATAALLARIGACFGPRTGLLAAALYLLCADPAFHATRLLNDTLACLLVAATWERCLAFRDEPSPRRGALAGLLAGLAVLTQPTLLLGLPLLCALPLLCTWSARLSRRAGTAAALLACALLPLGLSLAHNLAACGEPILVSAQGGVTFAVGNAPGADGTYLAIPGVSVDRAQQNQDARELVRAETDGSWKQTDAAFWRRGLVFWAQQPREAARLIARRLWWFLSGQHYGDIYTPALEAEQGLQRWAFTAPLPAPWLIFPGLVALLLALRARRAGLPELVLVLAPLLSVLVFFYSPRYRAPALPVLATFAAVALVGAFTERRGARLALILALLAGPAATLLNGALGFDDTSARRGAHERLLGNALKSDGRPQEALAHYQRAIELGATEALPDAGDLLRRNGQPAEGLALLREAAARRPRDADAQRLLGNALAESGSFGPARAAFEAALAVQPADPRTLTGLGNVLLQQGDAAGALARQDRALALRPDYAFALANRSAALIALGRIEEAVDSGARAVDLDPSLAVHVLGMLQRGGATDAQLSSVSRHTP
jgi:tetratricopeptide (TPR) repeat protein